MTSFYRAASSRTTLSATLSSLFGVAAATFHRDNLACFQDGAKSPEVARLHVIMSRAVAGHNGFATIEGKHLVERL
jgi:hypothetical protein